MATELRIYVAALDPSPHQQITISVSEAEPMPNGPTRTPQSLDD